ncbi:MAG: exodeoxyribonuclease VII small subunit [Corallococcus sp.]|nr:exodeoxyribonuclease VII small subunit [Bacillota bacterium]MCM1533991.1 exodeoxyribonuclease VII small subunit [Corallococcus sp.]
MNLEQKLAKLDELTARIEQGETLEKSLEIFEQSVILADECMKTLNDFKGKLVILQEKARKLTDEN